jgi:bla regulator protein blaR1
MTFALARHLVESTVFAVATGLAVLLLRRRGAAARHALWFLAAAKFAVPAGLFLKFGASLQSIFSFTKLSVAVPRGLSTLLMSQMATTMETRDQGGTVNPLILIWLAVAVAMLAMWLPRLFAFADSLEGHRELDDSFARLKKRVGLRRDVALRLSDSNVEPVLSGFWRPTVTIPKGLVSRLSPSEWEAVVLHELAHAKRWDNWTGAFVHALACVFWFHPLLWWIERRLQSERELACDEMVVRHGAAPRDYVESILEICRFHLSETVAGVSSVSSSSLTHRLEVIMSLSADLQTQRLPRALIGTLVATVTIIPLLAGLTAAPSVHGQSIKSTANARNEGNKQTSISCVSASVDYPEGTVIQNGSGPEQMCARVLDPGSVDKDGAPQYTAQWIHTSNEIRERSKTVVRLPQPPPFVCTPRAATQEKLCSCEEGGPFSHGANVDSAKGKLRCNQGTWVALANAHK